MASASLASLERDAARSFVRASLLWRAAAPAVLAGQILWFASSHPQPLAYDAGQYFALSQRVQWWGPVPHLTDPGVRTYAYPAMVRLLYDGSAGWLFAVQAAALAGLVAALRVLLLPPVWRADAALAALLLALPVLPPYAIVALSDLPGATALVGSLALLAAAWPGAGGAGRRGAILLLCMGGLLGFAVQLRPAYVHFAWAVLAALAVRAAWIALARRPRRWSLLAAPAAALSGFLVASAPTIVENVRTGAGLAVLPREGMDRLAGYQLMLGLSLDRWSSNPPPLEERERVAEQWRRRGWAILPIPPYPYPTMADFLAEVRSRPAAAAAQGGKHVYYAFEKREFFPYAGRLPPAWTAAAWMLNWLVLGLGAFEAARLARRRRGDLVGRFAALHLCLMAYLAATCALSVAEERFSLAAYPASLVFAAGWIATSRPANAISVRGRTG